jgi:ferric-dicitrate binding protein FerR (iron transport regulator)
MSPEQIKKYLEGKTSTGESEETREWLADEKNEAESRRILGEVWANSRIGLQGDKPDFDQMLNQIHHRINNNSRQDNKSRIMPNRILATFSRIAAVLIIPLLLVSVYLYLNPGNYFSSSHQHQSVREISTKPGTRTKVELADGTIVWLNDGTTLRYPESFEGKTREVYLDGEAYFEVKSNPKRPFVVENPMMTTVVTGTHFNLNAYSADNYFEATLLEGKINLRKQNQNVEMKPGEQIQYNTHTEKIVRKTVVPEDAAAWVDGKLIFNDERLEIVIKKLSRWYNVDIILADPELAGYPLKGTIHDEKLDQTLKLISLALPVKTELRKESDPTKLQRTIIMKKK